MALFFPGQSECPYCRKVISENDKAYLFPPFISNANDPFWQFNDAVFHLNCLTKHPLGKRATSFAERYFFTINPTNRICVAGKNPIAGPEDYIYINLLTSDEDEKLFSYSFLTLDRNNLSIWNDREDFISSARKFIEEKKWGVFQLQPDFLGDLINQVSA